MDFCIKKAGRIWTRLLENFKKNNNAKTIKEIKLLEEKYRSYEISDTEAYPYDLDILKEYYRNLYMKITRFPIFS